MRNAGEEWIEYPEVSAQSRALQTYLTKKAKLSPGALVLILLENRAEWLISDFACTFAGIISVPVAPTTPAHQLAKILEQTSVCAAICSAKQIPLLSEALNKDECKSLQEVILVDCMTAPGIHAKLTPWLIAISETEILPFVNPGYEPNKVAASLIFSSGSTGVPKASIITYGALNDEWRGQSFGASINFAYEPLAYSTQRLLAYDALSSGGHVTFFSGDMTNFFSELRDAAPTAFSGPPRIWNMLYAIYKAKLSVLLKEGMIEGEAHRQVSLEIKSYFGPNIRSVSTGGAPTAPVCSLDPQLCNINLPHSCRY